MKSINLVAVFLSMAVPTTAFAQAPEGRPPGNRPGGPGNQEARGEREGRAEREQRGERGRFPSPLMEALDKDKNGELSPEEIENAVAALKSLDKNSDGKIDGVELLPSFDGMRSEFGAGRGAPGGEGRNADGMLARMLAMDANKDGKLEKSELPERLQSMLARADKNEDGVLDRDEILAAARERSGGPGGFGGGRPEPGGFDFPGQMLERADANKDGKLSGDEIPPFMRERLEQVDTNKDGALDKAELEAAAARMREGRGQGRGEGRGRGQRPPAEEDGRKE